MGTFIYIYTKAEAFVFCLNMHKSGITGPILKMITLVRSIYPRVPGNILLIKKIREL